MLAAQLVPKYRYENCVVIALSDGGVVVGAQIAQQLHCVIMLLLSAEINLPREQVAIAGITPEGTIAYNHQFSDGEIDEMVGEYRGLIEQEKLERMHQMNQLLGSNGVMKKSLLKGHNIILVTDGLKSGFELDLVYEFLKPVDLEKLIVAVPLASVQGVDRMHILADDIYCLSVVADYLDTDHYYDKNDVPSHKKVIETIEKIVMQWK